MGVVCPATGAAELPSLRHRRAAARDHDGDTDANEFPPAGCGVIPELCGDEAASEEPNAAADKRDEQPRMEEMPRHRAELQSGVRASVDALTRSVAELHGAMRDEREQQYVHKATSMVARVGDRMGQLFPHLGR